MSGDCILGIPRLHWSCPVQSRTGPDHHSGPFLFGLNPTTKPTPHAYTSRHEDYNTCPYDGLCAWMYLCLPRRDYGRNGFVLQDDLDDRGNQRREGKFAAGFQFRGLLGCLRNDSNGNSRSRPKHPKDFFLFVSANRCHANSTHPNFPHLRAGAPGKISRGLLPCGADRYKQSIPLPWQLIIQSRL